MSKKRASILVVDDEAVITFALGEYFRDRGFHVTTASSREEAELALTTQRFDVVIADLRLTPGDEASGLTLAQAVADQAPGTSVIILTGYGTPEIEQKARNLGIQAFLHKPQPLATIEKVVRRLSNASCSEPDQERSPNIAATKESR